MADFFTHSGFYICKSYSWNLLRINYLCGRITNPFRLIMDGVVL
mgnify:FL=1